MTKSCHDRVVVQPGLVKIGGKFWFFMLMGGRIHVIPTVLIIERRG